MMKLPRSNTVFTAAAARPIGAAVVLSLACLLAAAADMPNAAASAPATAKAMAPKRAVFASPQEGFEALISVLRQHDFKGLGRLLGPGHERISDSGDSVADRAAADRFVADYDLKHTIQLEGDTQAFVTTGPTDWPMPIPMVKKSGGWSFDADAGEDEIITRRIGRNELDVIQVCLAFADMEREYAEADTTAMASSNTRRGSSLRLASAMACTGRRARARRRARPGHAWPVPTPGRPRRPAHPRRSTATTTAS